MSPAQRQPERGWGGGKGWPPELAPESPALGAEPTHLAREIVARPAGWGALGGEISAKPPDLLGGEQAESITNGQ